MALGGDEMSRRREKRAQQRAQQLAQQRKLRRSLIVAAVVLLLCGVGIFFIAKTVSKRPVQNLSQDLPVPTETAAPETEPETVPDRAASRKDPITKIHIRACGDLNVTNAVVESGLSATGYDFTRAFMDVSSVLSEADLTMLNLEGNICGEPYGSLTASAPGELLKALRNAGVDLVQMANSYSIYNGLIGLNSTLSAIRVAGLEPVGAYSNPQEFKKSKGYTICDVQGIKVAVVAFTKGVGGMGMPAGNEDCVNLLYTDYDSTYKKVDETGITRVLNNVASEKPDVTIALLHWGSENDDEISKTQNSITNLMKKKGVDIIIGTHPHLVQKVEFDKSAGTLIAYSLGDFFGDATRGGSNYSVVLDIEITRDADMNTTKVTGFDYIPIFTVKEEEGDGYRRVVRLREAMAAYENNYVDKVTREAYDQMEYSLKRIEARIKGEKKEDKK